MKIKMIALTLVSILAIGLLSACGSKPVEEKQPAANEEKNDVNEQESAKQEGAQEEDIDWPTKTVEVVIHAGAGGDTDFNTRTMAKYFEKITGQSMVVTNMTGGGGSVATSYVKDANPDGYTMLGTHTGPMIVNEVAGLIDYNMDAFEISDLFAVDKGTVLVTSKESGITSVEDLVAKAKAAPETIVYGSELGGYSHLQGLMLQDLAGIQFKIVDTGSTSDKIVALLGGRIDLGAISYGSVADYEKTGELVILAQFNKERNEYLDQIPTLVEQGVDFAMEKPYIAAFPKGTDPRIVAKFDEIVAQIVQDPDYEADLKKGFNQPVDYYNTEDAIKYLQDTREDFMQYKDLLTK